MGPVIQNLTFAASIAGAICASQLPEFAQQYRQRIGGAVSELTRTVEEFDRDAAASGMSRQQALDRHGQATETLFRMRGESARRSVERLERLTRQSSEFAGQTPVWQPLSLARADGELLEGTWREFRPAVPITTAGLFWGLFGFAATAVAFFTTARVGRTALRGARRHRMRRREAPDHG